MKTLTTKWYSIAEQYHRYKPYTLKNFMQIPHLSMLSEEQIFAIQVVARVFPFRTNNYVVNELIRWEDVPNDPIFILNFPQKEMLLPHHFEQLSELIKRGAHEEEINDKVMKIRFELNPHPAGQLECNIPVLDGMEMRGMQHKYKETVLFFPSHGQKCHAFCTFCFRWPQFINMSEIKFAMKEIELLIRYVRKHPEVSDILFTGGDPLIMSTKMLSSYINPVISANLEHVTTIRIGTKSLSYWPYRFITDHDADELLELFRRIVQSGKNLAIMAHFSHPRELMTEAVQRAIERIKDTGAQIRTQSPILAHINDDPNVWAQMWRMQVKLGCIPYYMFQARDTGAQYYFGVSLERAWRIFREAYKQVSGMARTVRGPVMSAYPGKIEMLGVSEINNEKVFVLRMLQGRDPNWVLRPFFAKYNGNAIWIDELEPIFSERFLFQNQCQ
ncbi:MAG: lysine 2,3-aminomutase [Nitrospirae bacterium]|nr:MAG: lysine 2,3-aminomutase [Nitrospirota bacterium]